MQLKATYQSPAGVEPRFFVSEHLNEEEGYTYYFMVILEKEATGVRQTLFRLIDTEYAWKDSDTAKLAALAKQLNEKLPGDRIVEAKRINAENPALQEDVKQVKCPTMDMFLCIAWEEARRISERGTVYVLECAQDAVSGNMPSVDMNNRAHIFLDRADIEKQIAALPHLKLSVGEYSGEAITDEISRLRRVGVDMFMLHRKNGPVIIPCTLVPECNDHTRNIAAKTALQALKFIQLRRTPNPSEELKASTATCFNLLLHNLVNEPLLAAFLYQGETNETPDARGDRTLHVTQRAAAQITASKGAVFFGAEDYILPTENEAAGRALSFRTLVRSDMTDKRFMAVFTDMKELHALYGTAVRVAVLSFDDLYGMLNNGACDGIVINAKGINVLLGKPEMEAAQKERTEPVKIYTWNRETGKVQVQLLGNKDQIERIVKEKNLDPAGVRVLNRQGQPVEPPKTVDSKPAEEKADAPVPAETIKEEKKDVEVPEASAPAAEDKPKKRGFFGRLFGKKD